VIEQDRTEKRATTQCMVRCLSKSDSRKQLTHPGTHLRNDSHGWATDITGTHTANLEVKITHFDRIGLLKFGKAVDFSTGRRKGLVRSNIMIKVDEICQLVAFKICF
jgi:hypothetical protein